MDGERFQDAMNPEDTAHRKQKQRATVVYLRRAWVFVSTVSAKTEKNRRMAARAGRRRLGQLEHAVGAGLHGRDCEKSHLVAVSFSLDLVQVASHGIDLAR